MKLLCGNFPFFICYDVPLNSWYYPIFLPFSLFWTIWSSKVILLLLLLTLFLSFFSISFSDINIYELDKHQYLLKNNQNPKMVVKYIFPFIQPIHPQHSLTQYGVAPFLWYISFFLLFSSLI